MTISPLSLCLSSQPFPPSAASLLRCHYQTRHALPLRAALPHGNLCRASSKFIRVPIRKMKTLRVPASSSNCYGPPALSDVTEAEACGRAEPVTSTPGAARPGGQRHGAGRTVPYSGPRPAPGRAGSAPPASAGRPEATFLKSL